MVHMAMETEHANFVDLLLSASKKKTKLEPFDKALRQNGYDENLPSVLAAWAALPNLSTFKHVVSHHLTQTNGFLNSIFP